MTTWSWRLKFTKRGTPFDGAFLIKNLVFQDSRGVFEKLYCNLEMSEFGVLNQINLVTNLQVGTIRGLHFQFPPFEEAKLINVLSGSIFDVIIDLRPTSSTYLKRFEVILTAEENESLYIPKGFAHGYQTLSVKSQVLYLHSGHYNPEAESGLNYADPCFSIGWPLPISGMSDRDKNFEFVSSRKDLL